MRGIMADQCCCQNDILPKSFGKILENQKTCFIIYIKRLFAMIY